MTQLFMVAFLWLSCSVLLGSSYRVFSAMFHRTRPAQNRVVTESNSYSSNALYLQTSEHEERVVHESRLFSALTAKAVTSGKLQKSDLAELNEHIKLGVLFLNLGGPEKTEVREMT